ncbi:MAG: type VI secretion system tip protein VgrG [Myxococcales bacterium]|nr:type VI secretion system tip protein VgrG [Myxococcales bacterium]
MINPILHARLVARALDESAHCVTRVSGRERIGHPYELEIEIVGQAGVAIDEEALLGESASLILEHHKRAVRRVHGVIQRIDSDLAAETGHLAWTVTLVPRLGALALTTATEVTMDLSVPDIVADRLERAGLKRGNDFDLQLLAGYPVREFVVQFKESELAFVSRLCEHAGISLYFRQEEERDVVVFTDHANGFATEHSGLQVPFRGRGERQDVFDLRTTRTAQPARVVVKDYNYRTPGVALQANAETRGKVGQRFEYGGHFKTPDEADRTARLRAEELAWQKQFTRAAAPGRSSRPARGFVSKATRWAIESSSCWRSSTSCDKPPAYLQVRRVMASTKIASRRSTPRCRSDRSASRPSRMFRAC